MANTKTAPAKAAAGNTKGPQTAGKGKQEVATKKDQLPAVAIDMAADAGMGNENIDRDSLATPFLAIAQKMSPQVDKDDDRYVKGLEIGDLFLTSNNTIFKDEEGVQIVFCGFQRKFLRWAPRDQGGGFKGEVAVDAVAAARATGEFTEVEGKLFADNGDLIRDTRVHYVMVLLPDGSYTPAVLSMASTQIKKSKQLLTQLTTYKRTENGRTFTPPQFGHIFRAETIAEQNDQGSWRGWKFTREADVTDTDLYLQCRLFSQQVVDNKVRVDHTQEAGAAGSSTDENGEGF
jgi:hypothetical protein